MNKQYRLSDGRMLGFAEYGDLEGAPEFYFPGFPASRLEGRIMDRTARKLAVRIIAVDRPGYGLSTGKPGRTLLDWPDDIAELADGLGLDRFAVMGHSGGGPYAAACAIKMPHRLTNAGMVCSLGPVDRSGAAAGLQYAARIAYLVSCRAPLLLELPYQLTARCIGRHAHSIVGWLRRTASPPDRSLLARPELREMLISSHREAIRCGHDGVDQDLRIFTSDWGFRLEHISMPVHLWHGELDTIVPPLIGRRLAAMIPLCRAKFLPNEGHVSVPLNCMEDILGTMAN